MSDVRKSHHLFIFVKLFDCLLIHFNVNTHFKVNFDREGVTMRETQRERERVDGNRERKDETEEGREGERKRPVTSIGFLNLQRTKCLKYYFNKMLPKMVNSLFP